MKPRPAKADETNEFLTRLQAMLETTQAQLKKLKSGDYELRVSTVKKHNVKAHTRHTYERPYLARKRA